MCQCLISYNRFEFSRQPFGAWGEKQACHKRGPGGMPPPPVFAGYFNPISTRWESILYPSNTTCPSGFSDLTTAFSLWNRALIDCWKDETVYTVQCNCCFFFFSFLHCLLNNECYSFFNTLAFLATDSLFLRYII